MRTGGGRRRDEGQRYNAYISLVDDAMHDLQH